MIRPHAAPTATTQNWRLLGLSNAYRLTIAGIATFISLALGDLAPFGSTDPHLFRTAALIYLGLAAAAMLVIHRQAPDFESQATIFPFVDITLLTLLLHASGGLSSGLGLLFVIVVANASLLLGQRLTIFYAAVASIAIMLQHSWGNLIGDADTTDVNGFHRVALLGIGMFATAAMGLALSARLRATEDLAERRGADIANLQYMNDIIIERMQSGALVCNAIGEVGFINDAARKFLGVRASTHNKKLALSNISPDLATQLFQWLGQNPAQRGRRVFTTRTNFTLLPRFAPIGKGEETSVLIFLDDMATLKQQAQQLKMAALARLTASIAHEIRNPLGAIANAAQLLGESVPEGSESRRLTRIIEEQSRRMNVTIQNVTQLSRRDRVNPTRIALKRWLAEFTEQYCETERISSDTFTLLGPEIDASVDVDQINQVLSNLCQNAVRASPPFTGTPLVKLQTGNDTEGRPYVDIIDWGAGISPTIADNIFDPFFTTTPKGTGLGLYIARELCEGNGGTLDYRPGEGGIGSRFRITLGRPDSNTTI